MTKNDVNICWLMFCHQIQYILRTQHFMEGEQLPSLLLLEPQDIRVNMANFAQTFSLDDDSSCRGVKVHSELRRVLSEVPQQRADAEGFTPTLDYGI